MTIQINHDTTTHIVSRWGYGNVLLGDVNADAQALGVDVGEVVLRFLGIFVRDV